MVKIHKNLLNSAKSIFRKKSPAGNVPLPAGFLLLPHSWLPLFLGFPFGEALPHSGGGEVPLGFFISSLPLGGKVYKAKLWTNEEKQAFLFCLKNCFAKIFQTKGQ